MVGPDLKKILQLVFEDVERCFMVEIPTPFWV